MALPGKSENPAPLLAALRREQANRTPIWFMRQAGRYLPEYRALRAKAGSFLDLCLAPELAAEATLQPLRRYDLDAAIIFSDILLIPYALGQTLSFVEGDGPRLDPPLRSDLKRLCKPAAFDRLEPTIEAIGRVRRELSADKALIGFAGAPWTIATYMMAGEASADPSSLRMRFYEDRGFLTELMEILIETTSRYLIAQVEAGADVLQLFDSWAGGLPEDALAALSLKPMRKIAAAVKAKRPSIPIIFFPKGVGAAAESYARLPECDAISIDQAMPWEWARAHLSPHAVVQGGLDPLLVVHGGEAMEESAQRLTKTFAGVPYVFNLGHGLPPETPPDNVARLIEIVRRACEACEA